MNTRRWIGRVLLVLSFGVLTAFSLALELLDWRFRAHERVYVAFFATAALTLVLVTTFLAIDRAV